MKYQKILVEKVGNVAVIRLNDPAALNSADLQMLAELDQAVSDSAGSARALLLTGVGRAFCAGANLGGDLAVTSHDGLPDAGAVLESHINPLMSRLRRLPIPWISAVRGPAAGVGCSLAIAADLVLASESAYFLQAFSRIGLVPDGGSSWLLTRTIGRVRAMEMMMLGERVPAAKALEWGMVNRVVSEVDLEGTALELARGLAAGPTSSLAMIREVAWAAADLNWDQALAAERRLQREAGRTADHQEGVAAFFEKRTARFTGA